MATQAEVEAFQELAQMLGFGDENDGTPIVRMMDTLFGGSGNGDVIA